MFVCHAVVFLRCVAVKEITLLCLGNVKLHESQYDTKFELTLDQCSVVALNPDRWAVF